MKITSYYVERKKKKKKRLLSDWRKGNYLERKLQTLVWNSISSCVSEVYWMAGFYRIGFKIVKKDMTFLKTGI